MTIANSCPQYVYVEDQFEIVLRLYIIINMKRENLTNKTFSRN